jgi:hypothetical protein
MKRSFELQHVPEESLEEQQQAAPDPMEQTFADLMRWYARGDAVDREDTLKDFPIPLTIVRDFAQRTLGAA